MVVVGVGGSMEPIIMPKPRHFKDEPKRIPYMLQFLLGGPAE